MSTAIWTSYLLINCDRNSWSPPSTCQMNQIYFCLLDLSARMKYDSFADDWISTGRCRCAIKMRCGFKAIPISNMTPVDAHSQVSSLLYIDSDEKERKKCNARRSRRPWLMGHAKTTRTSLEKVIKIIYDSLSSRRVARNQFNRSHTIFSALFSLVHSIPIQLRWRVDCVAVFQWNIFNWKFLKFLSDIIGRHIKR